MLSEEEIKKIGFYYIGKDCKISPWARFYNAGNITIGNNVRIDDFTILSAGRQGIYLASNIHIGCHCSLIGDGKIQMDEFSGLSAGVKIYSSTDNFSGEYYCNAVMPLEVRDIKSATVRIKKFSNIAAGCILMPGTVVGENCALGAMSFLKKSIPDNQIWAGCPAKLISYRYQNKYAQSS